MQGGWEAFEWSLTRAVLIINENKDEFIYSEI